jgi:hypothetical protein
MNINSMTYSGLARFAEAIDRVLTADNLTAKERVDLICEWAYKYKEAEMPKQLEKAITRCQGDIDDTSLQITATCRINRVSGKEVPFNPTSYIGKWE